MVDKLVAFSGEPIIEITLKEVYEKAVKLEARFDLLDENNKRTTSRFTWYVLFLATLSLINTFLLFQLWQKMQFL